MQIHAYRRKEPTPVELFGQNYLFKPNDKGHCVADVEDERAVHRLVVELPEGYRQYDPDAPAVTLTPAPAPVAAPVAPPPTDDDGGEDDGEDENLLGSDVQPAMVPIAEGIPDVPLGEIVAEAFARSGLKVQEWNDNDADDREALIEGEITRRKIEADEAKKAADTAAPAAAGEGQGTAPSSPLVVSNGEQSVDIGVMSAKQVREFAAQVGVELPKGNSTPVAELRQKLYDALSKA